jgi:hypothetical protein
MRLFKSFQAQIRQTSLLTVVSIVTTITTIMLTDVSVAQRCIPGTPGCSYAHKYQQNPPGTGLGFGIQQGGGMPMGGGAPMGGGVPQQNPQGTGPGFGPQGVPAQNPQGTGLGFGLPQGVPMSQACVTQIGVCAIWQPLYSPCACQAPDGSMWNGQAQ